MRYSDIQQVTSSDSDGDEQTSCTVPLVTQTGCSVPLVTPCSPVCADNPQSETGMAGDSPSPQPTPVVRESAIPVPNNDSIPTVVVPALVHDSSYTSVVLAPAPLSDINQFSMLSDSNSTLSSTPDIMCRICRCEPGAEKIISPCYCAGSLQYVHQSCLLKWLKAYDCVNKHHCELCQYEFKLKPKPWMEWRMPALSVTEQRRATCLVVICILAVLIVLWSINDLVQNIQITNIYMNWGFWTKLLFIVFGLFILAFQYPTLKYFYLKLRESNQIVLWGEEGEEQELLETGKLKESGRQSDK